MIATPSLRWRLSLLAAGSLLFVGGSMHPGGTMPEMMANPDWLPGHSLVFTGYVILLAALLVLRRAGGAPPRTLRWLRFAAITTAAQAVEMAVHTMAYVDHDRLVAGLPTPVFSTHATLAVVFYPLFAVGLIGLVVAGARDRAFGSWWIAWLGVIGAAAQGMAAPIVILSGDTRFAVLFAGIAPLSVWVALAALWPVRARAAAAQAEPRSQPVPVAAGR
jgi:cytochrome bd-type quinol oxidase subunit 2